MYVMGGVPMCDASVHVDDLTCLAEVAMAGLWGVVVDGVLKAGLFAANKGLFKVLQLIGGEKWRHREDCGEVLIAVDNVLKAAKNMAQFLRSREALDDEAPSRTRNTLCPPQSNTSISTSGLQRRINKSKQMSLMMSGDKTGILKNLIYLHH
eukprot:g45096.t1